MYKPKQPERMQSDINNQFLSRPNEGLQFGSDGQTYSGGATGAAGKTFNNPRDESSYWDNDPTYKKMIAQMQSMPVGAARDALRKQIEDYRSNKFNVPKVPVASTPASAPAPAATPTSPAPAATPPATPPATLAPTPPVAPLPTHPSHATAPSSFGSQSSPTNIHIPSAAAAAGAASPASTQNTPASQPAKTGLTVDQVNQLKKRYEDALMMPMSSDPQIAQQQRLYLENLQKELGRAMSGPMGQGMEAGGVRMGQQSQARDEANKATSDRKADADASVVAYQAKQYLASKGLPATDEDVAKFLKGRGYTGDGHKLNKNIFVLKEKEDKRRSDVKTVTDLLKGGVLGGVAGQSGHFVSEDTEASMHNNPNHFSKIQLKALADQRQKEQNTQPTTSPLDTTKSQLEQMYKAGFIDETIFRKGMNDPYGHGKTIEVLYDRYVQKFNAQDPNQPFPENSA